MNCSGQINELAEALAKAQANMTAAQLDRENPFFHSRYATLASVWDAIRKPLTDNGLSVCQVTDSDDGRLIVETILMHASGQWMSSALAVKPVKDDPQGIGSAISYARRYGLSAMVGAVSDEDDDGNRSSQTGEKASPQRPRTPTEARNTPPPKPSAPPAPSPAGPSSASDIIARLRATAELYDTPEPPDEHLLTKTRSNIGHLVGQDVARSKALIGLLYGHTSSTELKTGECHAICDWINCRKTDGRAGKPEWVPTQQSVDEYKILTATPPLPGAGPEETA